MQQSGWLDNVFKMYRKWIRAYAYISVIFSELFEYHTLTADFIWSNIYFVLKNKKKYVFYKKKKKTKTGGNVVRKGEGSEGKEVVDWGPHRQ